MERSSLVLTLMMLFSLTSASAFAGTCYQSDRDNRVMKKSFGGPSKITLYVNGRGDRVDRLAVKGHVNLEEVILCSAAAPFNCGIEGDNGGFSLVGDGAVMNLFLNGSFSVQTDDGGDKYLRIVSFGHTPAIPLKTVSEDVCKKLFPYDNEIHFNF